MDPLNTCRDTTTCWVLCFKVMWDRSCFQKQPGSKVSNGILQNYMYPWGMFRRRNVFLPLSLESIRKCIFRIFMWGLKQFINGLASIFPILVSHVQEQTCTFTYILSIYLYMYIHTSCVLFCPWLMFLPKNMSLTMLWAVTQTALSLFILSAHLRISLLWTTWVLGALT